MSVSSEDVTHVQLFNDMMSKFENEESPPFVGYDPSHPTVFFTILKWYDDPEKAAEQLIELYKNASDNDANSKVKRLSVVRAFRYWHVHFREDFRFNPEVATRLKEFQDLVQQNDNQEGLQELMELNNLPEDKWGRSNSLKTPQHIIRRPSLGFDAIPSEELSEILTSLDYKLFRRIPLREFCIYAQCARMTEDTPRIEECIRLFNGITTWVVCNILREYTILKRADIIEKFIDAAKYLHELHGYNAMLAVVGGLNHFSVKRLQQTWSKVDKQKRDELEKWTNFFSMDFNYTTYRKQLQDLSADEFQQPALGILLKDLVAVDGQSKDLSDKSTGILNMAKYRKLWQQLSRLYQYQVTAPAITPDTERMSVFRAAITQSEMSDDALDELSMIREPPVADGKGGSPTRKESKLPKFADWAQGNMPQLDADAVKKHVAKMVDSVFRVYDKDSSGYISIDEFQSISSNFPFIESFSVLDRDKDGVISRDEMMDYFLSANTSLRESFKHNFVEHTFIATAYCEHCKGVLKGIVRQGVRCKDCGISCHKHCKDYVVVDCSKHTEKKKRARRHTAITSTSNGEYDMNDELSLKERLRRAESARDALSAENAELLAKLAEANAKIQQLNGYIATIRQHTIGFILEQMNTLQTGNDTAV